MLWNIRWAMKAPFLLLSPFETTWLHGMQPVLIFQSTAREDNTGRDGSRADWSSMEMVGPGLINGEVATPPCTRLSQQVWCVLHHAPTHCTWWWRAVTEFGSSGKFRAWLHLQR